MTNVWRRSKARLELGAGAALLLAIAGCGSNNNVNNKAATAAAPAASVAATVAPSAAATVASPAPTSGATAGPAGTAAASPSASTAAAAATPFAGKLSGAPVPLVVYSAQGYDKDVTAAFQKATGIPTNLVDDSTGPLLARVQAEKDNPQWGLLWVDGDEPFAALDQQGLLLKGYSAPAAFNDQGKAVLPKDGAYTVTGVTLTTAMIYDSSKISSPPASWQDLLKPDYKGAVGMNNPAISGPTFPYVAGMMQLLGGEDQGKAFFSGLKANGLHVYNTNKVTLGALSSGDIKIALIQDTAAIAAAQKSPNLKVAFLPKVTLLPSAIGIDAKAPPQEQEEAKLFVQFALSLDGQKLMQAADPSGDSLYYPVVNGVSPLPVLPALASIAVQVVDPAVWGPRENEINQWFSDNIVQQ